MGWKVAAALAAGVTILAIGAPSAALDDVDLSPEEIEVTQPSEDGPWTARVIVANRSEEDLVLDVEEVEGQEDCVIEESPASVESGESLAVRLTIPERCLVDGQVPRLEVSAPGRGEAADLPVITGPAAGSVDYSDLRWYAVGAGAALAVVAVIALGRIRIPELIPADGDERTKLIADLREWDPRLAEAAARLVPGSVVWRPIPKGWFRRWRDPLPELGTSWSLEDSWASSVGLGAALFTGVLGATDVIDGLVTQAGVEVVVTSGLISVALVAAAPLLLTIFQRPAADGTRANTVVGLLAAMVVVLAANLGQIAVLLALLLDASVSEPVVWSAAGVAVLVIVAYAMRNAWGTLEAGLTKRPTAPAPTVPPTEAAATLGTALFRMAGLDLDDEDLRIAELPVLSLAAAAPAVEMTTRRAAMI